MAGRMCRIAVWFVTGLLSALTLAQTSGAQTPGLQDNAPGTFSTRPSEYSGGGTSGSGYFNPPYAYDGSFTTASTDSVSQGFKGSTVAYETWFGFSSKPPGATNIQLNVNSAASVGPGGGALIYYSLDGGRTFTGLSSIFNNKSRPQQTDVLPLNDTQDLTQVQVKAYIMAVSVGMGASSASQSVYEIWISGSD
jgi:hypothetical protein